MVDAIYRVALLDESEYSFHHHHYTAASTSTAAYDPPTNATTNTTLPQTQLQQHQHSKHHPSHDIDIITTQSIISNTNTITSPSKSRTRNRKKKNQRMEDHNLNLNRTQSEIQASSSTSLEVVEVGRPIQVHPYPSPPPTNSQPKRSVPLPCLAGQEFSSCCAHVLVGGGILDSPAVLKYSNTLHAPLSPPPTLPTPTQALPPADDDYGLPSIEEQEYFDDEGGGGEGREEEEEEDGSEREDNETEVDLHGSGSGSVSTHLLSPLSAALVPDQICSEMPLSSPPPDDFVLLHPTHSHSHTQSQSLYTRPALSLLEIPSTPYASDASWDESETDHETDDDTDADAVALSTPLSPPRSPMLHKRGELDLDDDEDDEDGMRMEVDVFEGHGRGRGRGFGPFHSPRVRRIELLPELDLNLGLDLDLDPPPEPNPETNHPLERLDIDFGLDDDNHDGVPDLDLDDLDLDIGTSLPSSPSLRHVSSLPMEEDEDEDLAFLCAPSSPGRTILALPGAELEDHSNIGSTSTTTSPPFPTWRNLSPDDDLLDTSHNTASSSSSSSRNQSLLLIDDPTTFPHPHPHPHPPPRSPSPSSPEHEHLLELDPSLLTGTDIDPDIRRLCDLRRRALAAERAARAVESSVSEDATSTGKIHAQGKERERERERWVWEAKREARKVRKRERERSLEVGAMLRLKVGGGERSLPVESQSGEGEKEGERQGAGQGPRTMHHLLAKMLLRRGDTARTLADRKGTVPSIGYSSSSSFGRGYDSRYSVAVRSPLVRHLTIPKEGEEGDGMDVDELEEEEGGGLIGLSGGEGEWPTVPWKGSEGGGGFMDLDLGDDDLESAADGVRI